MYDKTCWSAVWAVRWANSTPKHGIARERSAYIVATYPPAEVVPLTSNPAVDGLLYLGDDPQGVALEVITGPIRASDETGDHLVIHAMWLRRQYRGRYGEIMREHWGDLMADDRVARTRSGVELTDELIARLAERAEAGFELAPRAHPGGRPSLGSGTSPRVQFRVDAGTFEALLARAAAEGRGVSEVAREALERYLREGQHAEAGSVAVPEGRDEPAVPGGIVAGQRTRRS